MIHTYPYKGTWIALDVYSGAIHILDELSKDLVTLLDQEEKQGQTILEESGQEKHLAVEAKKQVLAAMQASHPNQEDEIREAMEEVEDLIAQGQLFTEDSFRHLSLELPKRKTFVKALCLNVAHTCNLDCDYCFASQGKYHGKRGLMSREVAEQAIDFLLENSGMHRNLDVDFFGGEPMLNWDLVKHTVEYARSKEKAYQKDFHFTFTTNGMLMDEEVNAFLNQNMKNVVLSLDGRKEVHDFFRHTIDKKGSYDRILPHFKAFVASRGDQEYYMRGTYTKRNRDFAKDVLHMASMGFYRLSMEPVIGDEKEDYMLSMEDVPKLKEQYDLLAQEMIRRNRLAIDYEFQGRSVEELPPEDHPFLFYHFMLNLSEGPCIYKRISGCGSGSEYLAVTPWGDLYPCHQFVGEEAMVLGNVFHGITEEEKTRPFKECNTYSHPECQSCWAKLYCSGGCAANALHAAGDLKGVVPLSCALFQKRMECAIAIQVDGLLYRQQKEEKRAKAKEKERQLA